jgi:uncharacterized protein DUF4440
MAFRVHPTDTPSSERKRMTTAEAEPLLALEKHRTEAIGAGDLEALADLLADDYRHVLAPGNELGKPQYIEMIRTKAGLTWVVARRWRRSDLVPPRTLELVPGTSLTVRATTHAYWDVRRSDRSRACDAIRAKRSPPDVPSVEKSHGRAKATV